MLNTKSLATVIVSAALMLPTALSATVFAQAQSPTTVWKQVLQNTQKAPYMQVTFSESVNVTSGSNHETLNVNVSAVQEQHGKNIDGLIKVTLTDPLINQKQESELFQSNNNIYQYTASTHKWQLVQHSNSAIASQYASQLYTNIKVRNTRGGHEFSMGADSKQLAALVQGIMSQAGAPQTNMASVLKRAKAAIVADSSITGGNEKLTKLTGDIDIPTTANQLSGGSSGSDQTVTGSVYGSNGGPKVDIRVRETTSYTYRKINVPVPKGLPQH